MGLARKKVDENTESSSYPIIIKLQRYREKIVNNNYKRFL